VRVALEMDDGVLNSFCSQIKQLCVRITNSAELVKQFIHQDKGIRKTRQILLPTGWPEICFMRAACEHIKQTAGQAPVGRI